MGYYIPKTFFVEKLGVSGIDSYIDKQKKIIAKRKTELLCYRDILCNINKDLVERKSFYKVFFMIKSALNMFS